MIVRAAPPLPPGEAARRAAVGRDPVWLSSPGAADGGVSEARDADSAIAWDAVAADPARVVRGDAIEDLEAAWIEARRRWKDATAGVPIAVGWLSYDLARRWTALPARARGLDLDAPPGIEFRFFDAVWVRAAGAADARLVACDGAAADRLLARLDRAVPPPPPPSLGALVSDEPRAWHAAAVDRIKAYLHAGDAYQINLARRLTAPIGPGDPTWIAAALRRRSPAPHALWMGGRSRPRAGDGGDGGDAGEIDEMIIGNSPERFLHVGTGGDVETRPIKGTRPRTGDARADAAARADLAAAAKDRAEHVMIVDLERNDLGRVCRVGSVSTDALLRVVELPTVFHLVSNVRGRLRDDVGLAALVRATFPGGSITGAPKRRAMEIIDEIEPVRRGIYTGATGWLGAAGDLDLAVAIRTAIVARGRLSLSVGGGIVADSDPAAEWEETEVKARAFRDLCGAG